MNEERSNMNKTSKASEGIWNFCLIVSVLIANCILFTLIVRTNVNAAEFNIPAGDVHAMIDAINEANGNGEDDMINLEAGIYTLTEVNNTNDGNNGLPSITTTIIINGAGDDKTIIESRAFFRIFHRKLFFDNTFTEEEKDESTSSMGDNFPGEFGIRPITT